MKTLAFILLSTLLFGVNNSFAQKGRGQHPNHPHGKTKVIARQHHPNKVVVVRSHYRPAKMVVFHPHWGPKSSFNRRWVFFPRYNFYWDNWRQMYVYKNGGIWVVNTTPPPTVININIDNEKHYELKETDDDTDDVYKTNETHQTEYKPD